MCFSSTQLLFMQYTLGRVKLHIHVHTCESCEVRYATCDPCTCQTSDSLLDSPTWTPPQGRRVGNAINLPIFNERPCTSNTRHQIPCHANHNAPCSLLGVFTQLGKH